MVRVVKNKKIDLKYLYYIKSTMTDRVKQLETVQHESMELFKKKNKDYGDAFASFGSVGVIIRMGDKINRLCSVTSNGVTLVNDESIRDTLMDLHNYAAMAVMLIDEKQAEIYEADKSNVNLR